MTELFVVGAVALANAAAACYSAKVHNSTYRTFLNAIKARDGAEFAKLEAMAVQRPRRVKAAKAETIHPFGL